MFIQPDYAVLNKKTMIRICLFHGIKKYSNKRKRDIFELLQGEKITYIIKLQRWFRSIYCTERCPISLTNVVYPCYCFKPINSRKLIYYNLNNLNNFLISSGDFRDPSSREYYSDKFLKNLDKYKKNLKSVTNKEKIYILKRNEKEIYKKQREKEEKLLVLDRCIDDIVAEIRNMMEKWDIYQDGLLCGGDDLRGCFSILNIYYFPTFNKNICTISSISVTIAKQKLDQTINIISKTEIDYHNIKEYTLDFLDLVKKSIT